MQSPSSCEGRPGTEDSGGLQHTLQVWPGEHLTDCCSFCRDFNEGTPQARTAWISTQSAVAEHRFNHNHLFKFQDTQIVCTVPGLMERVTRGAVELGLHRNNMNREDSPNLRGSWKPLLRLVRDSRHPSVAATSLQPC